MSLRTHHTAIVTRTFRPFMFLASVAIGLALATIVERAEAQQADAIVHVDGDNGSANPTGEGDSWAEAYKYLQDGLDKAEALLLQPEIGTVEIWVAATDPGNPYVPHNN